MGKSGDNVFIGQYNHSIDQKGRIIIPIKLRNELGNNFILTRGLDGCLFIYSNEEWNNILTKYQNLLDSKEKRNFLRIFLSSASVCDCDLQGRINIPDSLISYANIKKDCIIIGMFDRLEIWGLDNWNDFISKNSSNLSEIADGLFKTS